MNNKEWMNDYPLEEKVFTFLDKLCNSGINMFGVSPRLQEEFEIDRWDANRYVWLWMKGGEWITKLPKNQ